MEEHGISTVRGRCFEGDNVSPSKIRAPGASGGVDEFSLRFLR